MRERKFKKSHIHILQTETLSRESRVTGSSQEIVDSDPEYLRTLHPFLQNVKFIILLLVGCFTRIGDLTWRFSDCEELVAPHEWNNYVPN